MTRAGLVLGALGVVFGDLGTSPLYTEQVTFGFKAARQANIAAAYGVVSLIVWTLAIVVSLKYAGLIMQAHNDGDGGIMALAALCRRHKTAHAALFVTVGVLGGALFLGDAMVTPAITVLSAVSGLKLALPAIAHQVVPISAGILFVLFMLQHKGSGAVGQLFGPVMILWFVSITALGVPAVIAHPGVLQALSPTWSVRFITDHGLQAFLALGGVVLCTTGGEALYADRGHFGPGPIRLAWFTVVWPAVIINYLGQGAWVLSHRYAPSHAGTFDPFFSLVPGSLQTPEVLLATAAAVIASQAVISGSYTVARLASRLGYLPHLRVIHTGQLEGQIYVPVINWLLAVGVIALVFAFRSADGLAHAYGLAVTGTFVLNTILFLAVLRSLPSARPNRKIGSWAVMLLAVLVLTVEVSLLSASLAKFLEGAWIPLAVAVSAALLMTTWHTGQLIVTRNRHAKEGDLDAFLTRLGESSAPIPRVPGTAIFLNPAGPSTPLALRRMVERIDALPQQLLIVSVIDIDIPHVDPDRRFAAEEVGGGPLRLTHLSIRNGYRDLPSVPEALRDAQDAGNLTRGLDLGTASYYLSNVTVADAAGHTMSHWRKRLFIAMARNAATPLEHFGLPADRTMSIGSQIEL